MTKHNHSNNSSYETPSSPLDIPGEFTKNNTKDNHSDDDRKPAARPSPAASPSQSARVSHITHLPHELQVNILTYLRAYELVAIHQVCRYYHDPHLMNAIVAHASAHVYPVELTNGFEDQPVWSSSATTAEQQEPKAKPAKGGVKKPNNNNNKQAAAAKSSLAQAPVTPILFTLEHLRNMELLVVARVLSRPEPRDDSSEHGNSSGGYYVSKSWCKTALKWLELQHERRQELAAQQASSTNMNHTTKKKQQQKKLSKKQQRLRQRKYSDTLPPWPNVNADLVCEHQQLQRCSNRKSARARRRLLDSPSWRALQKLYPESIALASQQGECWQCARASELAHQEQQQRAEQAKAQRKAPLSQPALRRFYTRTRGVPVQCLMMGASAGGRTWGEEDMSESFRNGLLLDESSHKDLQDDTDATPRPAAATADCPLLPGLYVVLPRAWCHAWRRYMKTGEGGPPLPPDASALLCDAHRLALVPPHLEDYLYGETAHLWTTKKSSMDDSSSAANNNNNNIGTGLASPRASMAVARGPVVGLSSPMLPLSSLPEGMAALGLTEAELEQQQRAMLALERQRQQEQQRLLEQQRREREQHEAADMNDGDRRRASMDRESLDRENYCCVEILTQDEFDALEKLWPRQQGLFGLRFQVDDGANVTFSAPPCRECDASGLANACKIPKHTRAALRAAHQVRVRKYAENKAAANAASASGGGSRPGLQLEY